MTKTPKDQTLFDAVAETQKTTSSTPKRSQTSATTPKKSTKKPAKKTPKTRRTPQNTAQTATEHQELTQKIHQKYHQEARLENTKLSVYLGKTLAAQLSKHLGVHTVEELLNYHPKKYLPRGKLTPFSELEYEQDVTLMAQVVDVRTRSMRSRRGSITEIIISDQLSDEEDHNDEAPLGTVYSYRTQKPSHPLLTGSASGYSDSYGTLPSPAHQLHGYAHPSNAHRMTLTFFNAWSAARDMQTGDHVLFSGKVGAYKGELTLTNPHYAVIGEYHRATGDNVSSHAYTQAHAPIPVYRANAKFPTDRISAAIAELLDHAPLSELEDPLPPETRHKRKIPTLAWTYRALHTPDSDDTWKQAQHSLRYREAFILQSALARIRAQRAEHTTDSWPYLKNGYAQRLLELLPYQLTDGQKNVGEEIRQDLSQRTPMNRLLQGDVGSGKTVVALRAMLQVIDSGGQAAMLAPTEVLAEQHYQSVCEILRPLTSHNDDEPPVCVRLLKASMPASEKKQVLLDIASGAADIVIGTHALLSSDVNFARLGLAVVDEQHRFGVEQRDSLRNADGELPHRLVMTATPIPRTVAMTVFGDLDISVLDQLPAGRQKIKSIVVPLAEHPHWEHRLWERAREEIDAGHQVYVVVPKVGEDISEDEVSSEAEHLFSTDQGSSQKKLHSAIEVLERLSHMPVLSGVRIDMLHGRLDTQTKAHVMQSFSEGDIQLLVCTTVVEVGVNVPNATLMMILDADRFGISGLHQLRGRIGRGQLPGTCLLVTEQEQGSPSRDRLDAVASTTDGFELSRIDLRQRREGDILGAAQSGKKSTLKLLRAIDDADIIEKAREDARLLIEEDPTLGKHPDVARWIERFVGAEHEQFLSRG
ncbi:ATP-dependent DNA helicase RecG [Rothia sp. P7208]|uniref:ATP-dependent DNA helicase RecG n=1 Tax=Rothia sp. P7208 TaxID=3402660 RepID=UPI003AC6380F